ncbi:hypothetical protein Trydic_g19378 [Trypoxylus dichotomus]
MCLIRRRFIPRNSSKITREYTTKRSHQPPRKEGLYDPRYEKEGCGVGLIVELNGEVTARVMRLAKRISLSMAHRGAYSFDNSTGDGAGILIATPHSFYTNLLKQQQGIDLPALGKYATGLVFLDKKNHKEAEEKFTAIAEELRLSVLAWREVPTDNSRIGGLARSCEPLIKQVFVVPNGIRQEEYDRMFYVLRKRATHTIPKKGVRFYICSLNMRTMIYKGQLSAKQLWSYFPDLRDLNFQTSLALVHNRFATNTLPSWELAHPYRIMAHNGEINTLRGNVNFMRARERVMESDVLGDQLFKLYPVIEANTSDSGSLDNMIEFLVHAGKRNLPESIMTLIPEAWHNDSTMSQKKCDFYKWSACAMEPWDGPALIAFTDGRYAGAVQDRNGLRPSRFYVSKDNLMVMASEIDMYNMEDPSNIILKSRLKPGRMLLIDIENKRLINDAEAKSQIVESRPHKEWLQEQLLTLDDFRKAYRDNGGENFEIPPCRLNDKRLRLFAYYTQIINMQIIEMIKNRREGIASMGNDTPLACLSKFTPGIFEYFKQGFAQVTNPPVDPDRERMVMSLECPVGPTANLLLPSAKQAHRLWLEHPILSMEDMEVLKRTKLRNWSTHVIDTTYPVTEGPAGLKKHLDKMCKDAEEASKTFQIIVLSDRKAGEQRVPVKSLMALGAIHFHLIEARTRMNVALMVEAADAKVVHEFALLLGYGADAICPYLPVEIGVALRQNGVLQPIFTDETIFSNYAEGINNGLLKVMARAGITTLQSYKNSQIFEAIGLGQDVINRCFKGTPSRIGGATLDMVACASFERHHNTYAYKPDSFLIRDLGIYHYRVGGEKHMNTPETIAALQRAAKLRDVEAYRKFRKLDMENRKHCLLRGHLDLKTIETPIPLTDVESTKEIMKRFSLGGMSIGFINSECHKVLAKGMARVGGKNNCGEGGEEPDRYKDPDIGCKVKQLGTARWGVTSAYLAHAEEIQIKISEGGEPGQGAILSKERNVREISNLRRCPDQVMLVDPNPHHDLYSIEDLSQLVHDLNCCNPKAKIGIKLTSAAGIGVIATGAVKCKVHRIVIAGHDAGTGGGSWTSILNSGIPWELGVSEVHQVLMKNHFRDRVTIQADGQIRTGFDVVVAALLGADEVALATAPLITLGCVLSRKCHVNTCCAGIATMRPELKRKFTGKPEHLVNYLFMLAHDVRFHMASMGIRNFQDLIGRTDLLKRLNSKDSKVQSLDFSGLLHKAIESPSKIRISEEDAEEAFSELDRKALGLADDVLEGKVKVAHINLNITSRDRAFGATLSYHISKMYSEAGLPDDCRINCHLSGSAGQSFCAFLAKGVTCTLEGDANDHVGKGLSGGTVIIYPPMQSAFESHLNVIAGNVCLYGATSGKIFLRGIAGERFAVRNSGATAVVEGVGDHCCEFMSSGMVLVLGLTGRNFGSGMVGGVAYVWDIDKGFTAKCDTASVKLLPVKDEKEIELIKDLLHEFKETTGSKITFALLKDFNKKIKEFVKVIPLHEYTKITRLTQEYVKPFDRRTAFITYPREKHILRPVEQRVNDFKEIFKFGKIYPFAKREAARCLDCATPFCQSVTFGCPLNNLIPNWSFLVGKNRWREALHNLLQTNNFPEFTGRVCPAPCETACVVKLVTDSVAIKNIECTIIDHAFGRGWIKPNIPSIRTDKKVAIVGGGPAGLACADQLNKAGHLVTVFDRNEHFGGLLYYGIPNCKLDKKYVFRRLDIMRKEGIQFQNKVFVGKDIPADSLLKDYDAIVLCIGSTIPYNLDLPGRKLKGVEFALDFLDSCTQGKTPPAQKCAAIKDKSVVIIGGGPCSIDSASVVIRYGAKSITTLIITDEPPSKRLPSNLWPHFANVKRLLPPHLSAKFKYGTDTRMYNTEALEFVDNGAGHVSGVRVKSVRWSDIHGYLKMKSVIGSEKLIPADYVIIATGYIGPERLIGDQLKLEYENKHFFKTTDYGTNVPKVFAAGDCRMGESIVVCAIAEGREAARNVDGFLIGKASKLPGPGGIFRRRYSPDCAKVLIADGDSD